MALSGCFHTKRMQGPRTPGTLVDVMRTSLVIMGPGDGGPSKLDRQALSWCVSAAGDRTASASPRAKGNEKSAVSPPPIAMGYG